MFGSDWHMPLMVNDIDQFFKAIQTVFSDAELAPYQQDFFAGNAARYLKLADFADRAETELSKACAQKYRSIIAQLEG